MPVSPARAAAAEILLRVEREDSYASELLHSSRYAGLPSHDHGLATELVMGVLRWRSLLDRRLADLSEQKLERLDPEVLTALRMGAYQLLFLSRVPARAAIFESVEWVKSARKRSAATFVNAILRKLAEGGAVADEEIPGASTSSELAKRSAHPEWLVARWIEQYGLDAARRICGYDQSVPETTIHVGTAETAHELEQSGIALGNGALLAKARRLRSGDITKTRAYRDGRVTIQDEASQLVAMLVGGGNAIFDCCAAPGSKTSLIARRNPAARVFAADLHPHRARLLRKLSHHPNIHVIAADARQAPFTQRFDRILADVPCSGTGTLARHPEIKWRLKPEDLLDLQGRQVAILKSALDLLVPGGRLVYSTCSLEREENEIVVDAALRGTTGFILADCREELQQLRDSGELVVQDVESLISGRFLRTLPGTHPCDGFFAAAVERRT